MTGAARRAHQLFEDRFGTSPTTLVRAPGRVNIIGEHTDYNDGFALPAAIDRELWIAVAPSDTGVVEIVSDAFDDRARVDVVSFDARAEGWPAYVQGVAWSLARSGIALSGWRGAMASDVPVGAGMSSSAALELAVARAFHACMPWDWEAVAMARACQRAENEWVGVNSGVMDQLASAAGRDGHALLLDCRSLGMTYVPLPDDVSLVILDTATRRELTTSGYNDRRRECELAAEALGVRSLRDASEHTVGRSSGVDDVLLRRARHVLSENSRTLAAADAMRRGDMTALGALLTASHASLRDDFDVSSDTYDVIVEIAGSVEGCFGARLMGGGFAGCAIALVAADATAPFEDQLRRRYAAATGLRAETHVCRPVAGASTLPVVT